MSRLPGPPAQVPTLTDIVPGGKTATTAELQELLIQRLLRQTGPLLEKRLREACERLIREHMQALVPQLVDEVERVVRESVGHGLNDEQARCPEEEGPSRRAG